MSGIASVHHSLVSLFGKALDMFFHSEERFVSPWRLCCPYHPICLPSAECSAEPGRSSKSVRLVRLVVRGDNREYPTSTNASFSFYLRPFHHQHRSTSSLTPFPFMSSVHLEVSLHFCPPFLPFSFMKDTCSLTSPSVRRETQRDGIPSSSSSLLSGNCSFFSLLSHSCSAPSI